MALDVKINVPSPEKKVSKPFPKLMKGNRGWIVELYQHPTSGQIIAIHRAGPYSGQIAFDFDVDDFTDYDGSITIQND